MKNIKLFEPKICGPEDSIVKVAKLFEKGDIRHIIVVENDKPIGIINTQDITTKVVAKNLKLEEITAEQVMNSPIEYVDINQEVEFAMKIMMQHKTFSCLVCENDKVKGIISYKQAMEGIIKNLKNEH